MGLTYWVRTLCYKSKLALSWSRVEYNGRVGSTAIIDIALDYVTVVQDE